MLLFILLGKNSKPLDNVCIIFSVWEIMAQENYVSKKYRYCKTGKVCYQVFCFILILLLLIKKTQCMVKRNSMLYLYFHWKHNTTICLGINTPTTVTKEFPIDVKTLNMIMDVVFKANSIPL